MTGVQTCALPISNDRTIARQIGGMPDSVIKQFISMTYKVLIGLDVQPDTNVTHTVVNETFPIMNLDRIPFNNESPPNYDSGGNYFNGLGENYYSCPIETDFTFNYSLDLRGILTGTAFNAVSIPSNIFAISVFMERYSSGFSVKQESRDKLGNFMQFSVGGINPTETKLLNISDQVTMSCTAGDVIVVKIVVLAFLAAGFVAVHPNGFVNFDILPTSKFKCLGAITQGGGFQAFNPEDTKVVEYSFRKNLSLTNFNTLQSNIRNQLIINTGNDPANDQTVWIERVAYNRETSETDFKLIT